MPNLHRIEGYPLSRDYDRLAELVTKSSIACSVDLIKTAARSPARIIVPLQGPGWSPANGIGYIWASIREDFVQQCERLHLEYFDFPRSL